MIVDRMLCPEAQHFQILWGALELRLQRERFWVVHKPQLLGLS